MGKGTIIGGGSAGYYNIKLDISLDKALAERKKLRDKIAELQGKLSEAKLNKIKTQTAAIAANQALSEAILAYNADPTEARRKAVNDAVANERAAISAEKEASKRVVQIAAEKDASKIKLEEVKNTINESSPLEREPPRIENKIESLQNALVTANEQKDSIAANLVTYLNSVGSSLIPYATADVDAKQQAAYDASTAREAAQAAYDADPSPSNLSALNAAIAADESAQTAHTQSVANLAALQDAVDTSSVSIGILEAFSDNPDAHDAVEAAKREAAIAAQNIAEKDTEIEDLQNELDASLITLERANQAIEQSSRIGKERSGIESEIASLQNELESAEGEKERILADLATLLTSVANSLIADAHADVDAKQEASYAATRAREAAQAAYDANPSPGNLTALNAAVAVEDAARTAHTQSIAALATLQEEIDTNSVSVMTLEAYSTNEETRDAVERAKREAAIAYEKIAEIDAGIDNLQNQIDQEQASLTSVSETMADVGGMKDQAASLEANINNIEEVTKPAAVATRAEKQAALSAATSASNAAQSAYDADPSPENLAALNAALAAESSAMTDYTVANTYLQLLESDLKASQMSLADVERAIESAAFVSPAWCTDYTETLSGSVGTIEINSDIRDGVLIRPGYTEDAAYSAARDGFIGVPASMSPSGVFYNLALKPAVQRWRPYYRSGYISDISYELNICTVTLDNSPSMERGLVLNSPTTIYDVPVSYMSCDARAFVDGDHVVVQFNGNDLVDPVVIGFRDHPRRCGVDSLTIGSELQARISNGGSSNTPGNGANALAGHAFGEYFRAWADFDLSGVSAPVVGTKLIVQLSGDTSYDHTVNVYDASSSGNTYSDLGGGNLYGSFVAHHDGLGMPTSWGVNHVSLSSQALTDINASLGAHLRMGFSDVTAEGQASNPVTDFGSGVNINENPASSTAGNSPKLVLSFTAGYLGSISINSPATGTTPILISETLGVKYDAFDDAGIKFVRAYFRGTLRSTLDCMATLGSYPTSMVNAFAEIDVSADPHAGESGELYLELTNTAGKVARSFSVFPIISF